MTVSPFASGANGVLGRMCGAAKPVRTNQEFPGVFCALDDDAHIRMSPTTPSVFTFYVLSNSCAPFVRYNCAFPSDFAANTPELLRRRRNSVSLKTRILFLALVSLCVPAATARAQTIDGLGRWEPLGPIPVDQAGAGRRGYVLPSESADVAEPGAGAISIHAVAANNFYREETGSFLITQRAETHTIALGYRRGFKSGLFRRFELGGQVQLNESDNGALNGFISGFESLWVSMTGSTSAKNQLRGNGAAPLPLGTVVMKDGRVLSQLDGGGSGFGDLALVAKAMLLDGDASSHDARVAARVMLNISGQSAFTQGNFTGIGLSLDKKLTERLAFHTDVRGTIALDRISPLGLPLARGSMGFSAGPELRIVGENSLSLQIDGNTTPYAPTGAQAFDENYGDFTFGLSHPFVAGGRRVVAQIYARENMNLPFSVRWNTDPDLSVGLKITIH